MAKRSKGTTERATRRASPPKLSKTRYLSGLQCHLKLWYDCYERSLASPLSEAGRARFAAGADVGKVAQKIRERMPKRGHLAEALLLSSNLWREFENQNSI